MDINKNAVQLNTGDNRTPTEYIPKGITTKITISSRASKKIGEDFYTLEYSEERTIPEDACVELERQDLWDTCNREVDNAMLDTWNAVFGNQNNE